MSQARLGTPEVRADGTILSGGTFRAGQKIKQSSDALQGGPKTILSTIHGSHLYGLAHAGSDHDMYEVYTGVNKTFARQSVNDGDDRLRVSFDRFLGLVADGVPQALEALYSTRSTIDPTYAPILSGLRPSPDEVRMRYRRTAINFGINRGGRHGAAAQRADLHKLRRHALRLALNLDDFLAHGRFDPTLTPEDATMITELAHLEGEAYEQVLMAGLDAAQYGGGARNALRCSMVS